MKLLPRDLDKLLLHNAGFVAQKRLARGVQLNYPEAVALISTQIMELIRDGRSVAELMQLGRQMLGRRQVMSGVPELLHEVQVEATFPDGTKLVTIHNPIAAEDGDLSLALYGSFLPVPDRPAFQASTFAPSPGECICQSGDIELNAGRAAVKIEVTNLGDRPIQVGSHYHFVETNPKLRFDRTAAYGKRLDIPAGTAVRFEPGETKSVTLVEIAGERVITGGNSLASGKVSDATRATVASTAGKKGFATD